MVNKTENTDITIISMDVRKEKENDMKLVKALVNGEPEEIAAAVDKDMNNLLIRYNEMLQEIQENPEVSQKFKILAIQWIASGAQDYTEKWRYDGRNEYSCMICSKLMETCFMECSLAPEFENDDTEMAKKAVNQMARMHRTLKQSFSGLVFQYLVAEAESDHVLDEAVKYMNSTFYVGWERCPMI